MNITALPLSSGLAPAGEGWVVVIHGASNCKKEATTDIKASVPNIWAKGCMFENCEYPILLDIN